MGHTGDLTFPSATRRRSVGISRALWAVPEETARHWVGRVAAAPRKGTEAPRTYQCRCLGKRGLIVIALVSVLTCQPSW